MDETKDHILSKKFWFFFLTGKLKDATALYPLPQVYTTPLYERKKKKDDSYFFNPRGWITGMAGSSMEGLKRANVGPHALHKLKTDEFHFKECEK